MTPIALAIACLLAVTLGYAMVCAVSPFGRCRKCDGTGRTAPARGLRRRPKPCKRCRATGLRLRVGRRIHNHSAAARSTAQRLRDDARQ
ncbi:hypothetical protein GCM10010495_15030 [Kitasatospora herbaricolor]|uniref:hypothetical protein n=1 Tax=Kitasatospora herbaricolor TaxID=68217 RepID=UPI00174CD74D|nr:hypothetical protein [Kitasatospora herbaricolor]MDQ0309305.1 DnaJ-class molecular chaperone [Kitasatospora herbaricolor]GGV04304.1 hypothetical protein GCM10010495_15030 [Kitasatospora herbaricolor]